MGDMLHCASRNELMDIDWHRIADLMWHEMTIQQACKELGYEDSEIIKQATTEQRRFLLDTSMLAAVRDDYLGER